MQLIGMLDSPYVRRVAITAACMRIPFEHRSLSVFRNFDEFSAINPVVKAPTLVCDDGTVLIDSELILAYLRRLAPTQDGLMPSELAGYQTALRLIGLALAACEKTVQHLYEVQLRPVDKQHGPWIDRIKGQLNQAWDLLELEAARAAPWLAGNRFSQADITLAVAWRFNQFAQPGLTDAAAYPALSAFSARAEALPEFVLYPVDG